MSYAAATPLMPHGLIATEDLTDLLWREVKVQAHNVGVFDMIYIIVNIIAFAHGH